MKVPFDKEKLTKEKLLIDADIMRTAQQLSFYRKIEHVGNVRIAFTYQTNDNQRGLTCLDETVDTDFPFSLQSELKILLNDSADILQQKLADLTKRLEEINSQLQ